MFKVLQSKEQLYRSNPDIQKQDYAITFVACKNHDVFEVQFHKEGDISLILQSSDNNDTELKELYFPVGTTVQPPDGTARHSLHSKAARKYLFGICHKTLDKLVMDNEWLELHISDGGIIHTECTPQKNKGSDDDS